MSHSPYDRVEFRDPLTGDVVKPVAGNFVYVTDPQTSIRDQQNKTKSIRVELEAAALASGFDPVSKPKHYNSAPAKCACSRRIECIDVTRWMNFNLGNVVKYMWRADEKGNRVQDLEKAAWYLNDEINRQKSKEKAAPNG